jgi:hypothetical protein
MTKTTEKLTVEVGAGLGLGLGLGLGDTGDGQYGTGRTGSTYRVAGRILGSGKGYGKVEKGTGKVKRFMKGYQLSGFGICYGYGNG